MTKQMNAATLAAMVFLGTLSMQAQLTTTTKMTKVAPGETKTTVVTKENSGAGATHKKKRTAHKATAKKHVESATERQLRELREKTDAQQAQIDALKQQGAEKDAAVAAAQSAAQNAQSQAAAAAAETQTVNTSVQENKDAVTKLNSTVTDLQTTNTGLATTISANKQELTEKIESPTVLHYKGVTITPVAFFALEGVYRTRSVNSDVNTPFNTTPFQGANEAHVSEFNLSGRQSRLGGLFEGNAGAFKLSGYFEADFLSAGTTSNGNQSNSFTLRQRQIWGQAATKKGFTVTGGQMWSLVTETGKSTDNRTEKLPNTIDAQYMVGFNWARQPGLRLQQKFASPDGKSAFTVAMSLEQAQLTNVSATNAPTNLFFNGAGQNGGLFNAFNGTPTNNVAPDVFVKTVVDLPHSHFELGGVARFMRVHYYPGTSVAATGYVGIPGAGSTNDTKFAGGVFGNARVTVSKYLDVAASGMAGDGVGRYGSAQLADATFHTNGTLEPLRNYHALFSLEGHPTPKLDVYGYAGGEYVQRTVYATGVAATPFTGYGAITANDTLCNVEVPGGSGVVTPTGTAPAACSAPTRDILEGMVGFTYRIVNSPKIGRLQYQVNYNYLTKTAWTGLTGGTYGAANATFNTPTATNNMVFMGMRYYIP